MTNAGSPEDPPQPAAITPYVTPAASFGAGWTILRGSLASGPRVLRVPTEFPLLQQAIDAANDGDTIEILPGIYECNVTVQKGLLIRGRNEGVQLRALDSSKPIIGIAIEQGELRFQEIVFEGRAENAVGHQVGIEIHRGEVCFRHCQFRGWNTLDQTPEGPAVYDSVNPDRDFIGLDHSYWQWSAGISATGEDTLALIHQCQFGDSEVGISVCQWARALVSESQFFDLWYAICLQDARLSSSYSCASGGTYFVFCRHECSLVSDHDTATGFWTLIKCSHPPVLTAALRHATIRTYNLYDFVADSVLYSNLFSWYTATLRRYPGPRVSFVDSILELDPLDGDCLFVSPPSSRPYRLDEFEHYLNLSDHNIVASARFNRGPNPLFDDSAAYEESRLRTDSPAIGAASDGTNIGAWQGTPQ